MQHNPPTTEFFTREQRTFVAGIAKTDVRLASSGKTNFVLSG